MRPKIYLPVLGLAGLTVILLWPDKAHRPKPGSASVAEPAAIAGSIPVNSSPPPAKPAMAAPIIAPDSVPAKPAAITGEELQALAMNNDAESLQKILAALNSSDPEIRAAAREAAVQFGDRSAAVQLRAAADAATDYSEKQALLEAADFLELPSLDLRMTNRLPAPSTAPR
jgi:hypothetical protein